MECQFGILQMFHWKFRLCTLYSQCPSGYDQQNHHHHQHKHRCRRRRHRGRRCQFSTQIARTNSKPPSPFTTIFLSLMLKYNDYDQRSEVIIVHRSLHLRMSSAIFALSPSLWSSFFFVFILPLVRLVGSGSLITKTCLLARSRRG